MKIKIRVNPMVNELLPLPVHEEDELSASEALFGFTGWLTTRDKKTVMSASNDTASVAQLVGEYCDENNLKEPKDGWDDKIKQPEEDFEEEEVIRNKFKIILS